MIEVRCHAALPLRVGLVSARSLEPDRYPAGFEARLDAALARRKREPEGLDEVLRAASRDMLRHGRYKPTGRGKPASEYLVRAAVEDTFPRINPAVDICNLVSLESLFPISLWDIDKAGTERYVVRHGRAGESYVFNAAGQVIELEDLVVGCRIGAGSSDDGEPIVNPVKDSLATKTDAGTCNVAAVVYAPLSAPVDYLARCLEGFADLLAACSAEPHPERPGAAWVIVEPGERSAP